MSDDEVLETGRFVLRRRQRHWSDVSAPAVPDVTGEVLELAKRRAELVERLGSTVRVDGFRFEAAVEDRRQRVTARIVERVAPGPDESVEAFERLARQLATLEMLLEDSGVQLPGSLLIGTTNEPRSHAAVQLVGGRVFAITLPAGVLEAYRSVAHAVVSSWRQEPTRPGSRATFSSRPEDTRAELDKDDRPVKTLVRTFMTWFRTGVADGGTEPLSEQRLLPFRVLHPPCERFVLAHEVGHVLMDHTGQSGLPKAGTQQLSHHDKEFRADVFATQAVARSAATYEQMAPNMVLQGALMSMRIHELAEEAIELAVGRPLPASSTHPPFPRRRDSLEKAYLEEVREELPHDHRLALGGLTVAVDTVDELWRRALPRIKDKLAADPAVHELWHRKYEGEMTA